MTKFVLFLLGISLASALVMPRKSAPLFKTTAVVNEKFETVSLDQYRGKWVVLFFYPFDFTFVCPTEILAFSKAVSDFARLNTQVLGVSTDSQHTHLAWIRTTRKEGGLGELDFPLLADVSKDISRAYGVLVEDKEDEMYGAALRGLFLIDPSGVVRSVTVNDDAVGRSLDEALRLIKAFQFADKHGEVCPANWKPGDATIIPSPDESKAFFSNVN